MSSLYCTPDLFRKLSATQAMIDRWDAESILTALQAASAYADTYIMSQLTLPLPADGYDMWLTELVADIAAYRLFNKFGYNGSVMNADQPIIRRFRDANEWLIKYSKQEVNANWFGQGETTPEAAAGPYVYSGFSGTGTGFGANSAPSGTVAIPFPLPNLGGN